MTLGNVPANPSQLGNLSKMTGLSQAELAKRAEQLVDAKTGKISALAALEAALVDAATAGKANMESFTAAGSASANPHTIDEPLHEYTHGVPMEGFAPEPPAPPSIGGPAALLEKAAKMGAGRISGFCGGCAPPPPPAPEPVAPEAPPPPNSPERNAGAGGGEVVVGAPAPATAAPVAPEAPAAPAPSPAAPPPSPATPPPQSAAPPPAAPAPARSPLSTSSLSTSFGSTAQRKGGFVQPGTASATSATKSAQAFDPTGAAGAQSDIDASSRNLQFEMLKNQVQKMSEMQNLMSNVLSAMHEQGMTAIRNVKA